MSVRVSSLECSLRFGWEHFDLIRSIYNHDQENVRSSGLWPNTEFTFQGMLMCGRKWVCNWSSIKINISDASSFSIEWSWMEPFGNRSPRLNYMYRTWSIALTANNLFTWKEEQSRTTKASRQTRMMNSITELTAHELGSNFAWHYNPISERVAWPEHWRPGQLFTSFFLFRSRRLRLNFHLLHLGFCMKQSSGMEFGHDVFVYVGTLRNYSWKLGWCCLQASILRTSLRIDKCPQLMMQIDGGEHRVFSRSSQWMFLSTSWDID